jgi:hypothetical protein
MLGIWPGFFESILLGSDAPRFEKGIGPKAQ